MPKAPLRCCAISDARGAASAKYWRPAPIQAPFFFVNDTATTDIYTLSLHDALPIWPLPDALVAQRLQAWVGIALALLAAVDRKSTRLNSSHPSISYAVFCLKKKKLNARDVGGASSHSQRAASAKAARPPPGLRRA